MNRLYKIILKNFIRVPSTFFKLVRYAKEDSKVTKEEKYALLQYIVERTKATGDLEIQVFGRENIPKEDGWIFYPNHQGIFDGFAMIEAYPKPFSPVIKIELMKYPIVSHIFRCMYSMPMIREDARQSMKVMQEVERRIKNKDNCLIFPEGTRSKNGNHLLEFKGGSFRPAMKTKCPIIPVALIDSYKPFDLGTKGHIVVQVHILEPLYYDDYKDLKTNAIADLVKERIDSTIKKYEM